MRHHADIFVLVALIILCTIFWWCLPHVRAGQLTVSFLDVGQGDAILIESPTGVQVLVDGGPDTKVLSALASVMSPFDRTIDMIVGTHPDGDHVSGLVHILRRMQVHDILYSEISHEAPGADAFDASIKDFKSFTKQAVLHPHGGDIFAIGGGAYIRVLYPLQDVVSVSNTNDASIVIQVVYGDVSFLLTGDAPQFVEEKLVRVYGTQIQSTVLKLGHHGSDTSSSEIFLKMVSPEHVVISRGCNNVYGHPHASVMKLISSMSVSAGDTCEKGNITFSTDGVSLSQK